MKCYQYNITKDSSINHHNFLKRPKTGDTLDDFYRRMLSADHNFFKTRFCVGQQESSPISDNTLANFYPLIFSTKRSTNQSIEFQYRKVTNLAWHTIDKNRLVCHRLK